MKTKLIEAFLKFQKEVEEITGQENNLSVSIHQLPNDFIRYNEVNTHSRFDGPDILYVYGIDTSHHQLTFFTKGYDFDTVKKELV